MLHSFSGDELFTALLAEQRVRWVNPRCSHAFTIMKTDDSLWERTAVQNLFRYRPSGTYFGRFRAGGKVIRQSLDTPF